MGVYAILQFTWWLLLGLLLVGLAVMVGMDMGWARSSAGSGVPIWSGASSST